MERAKQIEDAVLSAVAKLQRRSQCAVENGEEGAMPWPPGDAMRLRSLARKYGDALASLERAAVGGKREKTKRRSQTIFCSFATRIAASVRVLARRKAQCAPSEVIDFAENLDMGHITHEVVTVQPLTAHSDMWKPKVLSGHRRAAQQIILTDMLFVRNGDNPGDSTVAGSGGEKAAFAKIGDLFEEGYSHWVSIDIKQFFLSLRPAHLRGFPLAKWVIENLIFLPKEATIIFNDKAHHLSLTEREVMKIGENEFEKMCSSYPLGYLKSMLKKVRQGLPMGDRSSPQIARSFLGQELQQVLEQGDAVWFSHMDDILLGARTRRGLERALKALVARLGNHPAGPLELHPHRLSTARGGFEYLGYKVSRRKDGSTYVRPALKRYDRFRQRLLSLWQEKDGAFEYAAFHAIGMGYARRWFKSHSAWTKAPKDPSSSHDNGPSWEYLIATVSECLNYYMYCEWRNGFMWIGRYIDFEAAEDFELKTSAMLAF